MVTELQKKAAQAIVNVFETGSAQGNYSNVTAVSSDPGHLTYGRSQTTLASGNLHILIKAYCEAEGAKFAGQLKKYLSRLGNKDFSLDHDLPLHNLLRQAGADPVMRAEQDEFFDRVYWNPAVQTADTSSIRTALGVAVVYDSRVHGSWGKMRDRTINRHGGISAIGEREWIKDYVDVRREWLATHSIKILRLTVYRMETFRELIAQNKWNLELPLRVRGILINKAVLDQTPEPPHPSHPVDPAEQTLLLTNPHMRGSAVRALQKALSRAGINVTVDGDFGPQTKAAVKEFQKRQGLKVDGIVGPVTHAALDL